MSKRLTRLLRASPFFHLVEVAKYIRFHPEKIADVLLEAQ